MKSLQFKLGNVIEMTLLAFNPFCLHLVGGIDRFDLYSEHRQNECHPKVIVLVIPWCCGTDNMISELDLHQLLPLGYSFLPGI
jgi:hypothetical protein